MKNNYFFTKSYSNIYKSSSKSSEVISQILYGEKFTILSKNKNWIKIKSAYDDYVGYIKSGKFLNSHKITHKVSIKKANIFDKLNNKTKFFLPFASRISIIQENKRFIEFEKDRWLKKKDLKKIEYVEKNFTKIVKMFLGAKYIWGGKTSDGIDCSALLQLIFFYNNKFYPRDTGDQLKFHKKNKNSKIFKKGDIIFWYGHVAICLNKKFLIHAYGPKKKVIIMNIKDTILEIKRKSRLKVIGVKNINDI